MVLTTQSGQTSILGIRLNNLTKEEALGQIRKLLDRPQPGLVCFLNAHYANQACANPAYRRALAQADLVLADGSGLALAGLILKNPVRENLNGTDLIPWLFKELPSQRVKVYLLGARPGVAEKAARCLRGIHPKIEIAGWHHGYFPEDQTQEILARIALHKVDVLLAAMGAPKQELWLAEHLPETGAGLGLAVGGLFDFLAGEVPRAPLAWRGLGIEWLWRLFQEPGRLWRRYLLGNFLFLHRVWRQSRERFP
ncbi:WecB/TagA/CpsF family glycosyltransferase [Dethiosulfatarculus sandiegensis]|uniref:WecB/TagA/CpsF family glycosyltransferase n=1 Tax=Dethiosulfatarculus sandiegensis TaxID=1429043 RepID=UPI0009E9A647|nr:WecB/TagA/CpsF family glycosyltransferase [Dethiosulfatarculus sandiegensis]